MQLSKAGWQSILRCRINEHVPEEESSEDALELGDILHYNKVKCPLKKVSLDLAGGVAEYLYAGEIEDHVIDPVSFFLQWLRLLTEQKEFWSEGLCFRLSSWRCSPSYSDSCKRRREMSISRNFFWQRKRNQQKHKSKTTSWTLRPLLNLMLFNRAQLSYFTKTIRASCNSLLLISVVLRQ